MVSHRLRSISSVFGGKNSKEILGAFGARLASGGVNSVISWQTPLGHSPVQVSCWALKYAKHSRSNSPSVMGNCPISAINLVLRLVFYKDGQKAERDPFPGYLIKWLNL